jgi:hypothetical protein
MLLQPPSIDQHIRSPDDTSIRSPDPGAFTIDDSIRSPDATSSQQLNVSKDSGDLSPALKIVEND